MPGYEETAAAKGTAIVGWMSVEEFNTAIAKLADGIKTHNNDALKPIISDIEVLKKLVEKLIKLHNNNTSVPP
uniref:Uncharacterized protein n=1 Tax=viral metagenome TaxID=1070528 RepID=A0A6C0EK61_9ZZZZ